VTPSRVWRQSVRNGEKSAPPGSQGPDLGLAPIRSVAEGGSIWIQRFKEARRRFITAAGRFGLDHDAKRRAAEARHQMTSAAEEISKDAGLLRGAERAGIVGQVKSLTRENRRGLSKERGFELER